jgi:molybdate transport system substrate-binding protein
MKKDESDNHQHSCRFSILLFLACIFLAAQGCTTSKESAAEGDRQVLLMAAASTQDALEKIADRLRRRGGPALTISPAGSNVLAQQIIAGAPGDLFLSANQSWADEVEKHGDAAETIPLLSGELVIVVPAGNPAEVHKPDDLLSTGVRSLALADEHVPAGMYAEQALGALGLYDKLVASSKMVRGQNVRFALAYVERGEAQAGIVYASDAAVATGVEITYTFDPDAHDRIVYPLVLLKRGSQRSSVREAFEFLQSEEAAKIFQEHGFRPLTGAPEETR